MRTSKPFSTISYNSIDFLLSKLNTLTDRHVIDFWSFIEHTKEEDEEKDHIHLYIVPSGLLDTNQFSREFIEFLPGESKPRRFRPCVSSKFDQWYLYCLHNSAYLASKGQTRKYHYDYGDFFCSDSVYMLEQIHQIDWTKINPLGAVIQAARSGITFSQFLEQANLSLLQVRSAQFVFEQVQGGNLDKVNRNCRLTHSPE